MSRVAILGIQKDLHLIATIALYDEGPPPFRSLTELIFSKLPEFIVYTEIY